MYGSDHETTNIMQLLKNPRKVQLFLKNNKKEIIAWSTIALIAFFVYKFFSSGDFSFLMTLASLVQTFGFLLVT